MAADEPFESSKDLEERGFRHWERFELEEALQVFSEGVGRFPADRKLRLGLAFTRLDLGDLPQARNLFQDLLELDPKDDESWWGLGRIHLLLEQLRRSPLCFRQGPAPGASRTSACSWTWPANGTCWACTKSPSISTAVRR